MPPACSGFTRGSMTSFTGMMRDGITWVGDFNGDGLQVLVLQQQFAELFSVHEEGFLLHFGARPELQIVDEDITYRKLHTLTSSGKF